MSTYILQKDIDWFGKKITAGTRYVAHGNDYYWPVINDAHCPSCQVDFYTVKNNPEYFKRPPALVVSIEGEPASCDRNVSWCFKLFTTRRIEQDDWDKIKKAIEEITAS